MYPLEVETSLKARTRQTWLIGAVVLMAWLPDFLVAPCVT